MTRVDVTGCTWTQDFSFSSATIHAAFATPTRGWQPEHRYHEGFDLTVLWIFGTHSVLSEYLVHFHRERNHQGKGNVLLFPAATQAKNRFDG